MDRCEHIQKQIPDFIFLDAPVGKDPDQRSYIVPNAKIEATCFKPMYSLDAGIIDLLNGYTDGQEHELWEYVMIGTALGTELHRGSIKSMLRNIYKYRSAINSMVRRELAVRYVGTMGGPLWVILQPIATVIVFWFVFSIGFKAQGPSKTSFILYFLPGYLPWLLFSEALNASIQSIVGNSHLVKKTIFPTEILPVVHFAASSFTHLVLLACTTVVLLGHGMSLHVTFFQIIYYYGALACLLLGFAWMLAALQVFHRDVGQVMTMVLNLWFWATPIVWNREIMPQRYDWIIDYNPLYYIVEGYRQSLMYGIPMWHDLDATLRFWATTLPIFLVGLQIFGRLKAEFADVL